jgi:hypothetical protein
VRAWGSSASCKIFTTTAAAAVTAWRRLRVALFGYAMNDMGDIRVDESALVRSLGRKYSRSRPVTCAGA